MLKKILILLTLFIVCAFSANFKCNGRTGWAYGTGRYNYQGEYSSYWNTYANAGEFVLFQYHNKSKIYWFKADKCIEQ